MEIERRCFSKVILESNVTHNITKSSDSFSTVLPIINSGDWGCIVRDLEAIIVLVLLAFNSNKLLIIEFGKFSGKNQVNSSDFNATIPTFSWKHYHQFSNVLIGRRNCSFFDRHSNETATVRIHVTKYKHIRK